jgi:hypothetical protein
MDDLFQMFGELLGEVAFGAAGEIASGCAYRPATWLAPGPEIHCVVPHPLAHGEQLDESLQVLEESKHPGQWP